MKEKEEKSLEELWELYPIILQEHNPDYSIWYDEEKETLHRILSGNMICRINHIGSTSVAGLIAKPTIDILLEHPYGYDICAVAQLLQQNGWILFQKNDVEETLDLGKGYTPTGFAEKVFHLHIKPSGDWGELYFRDYLQQNPDVAREYETLKLSLKKQYEHNRDAYTNAKSEFVMENTQKARTQYAGRYQIGPIARDWPEDKKYCVTNETDPHGIIVFGANGSGKTTLGRELARILGFKHIDIEDYCFEASEIPYTRPRSREDYLNLMLADIEKYHSFVITTVIGDLGDIIPKLYQFAVYLSAPFELRMERVKKRSYEQYEERILQGGDMYEQELRFFDFVASRPLSQIDHWAKTLSCPIIRIDGAEDWRTNAVNIAKQYLKSMEENP